MSNKLNICEISRTNLNTPEIVINSTQSKIQVKLRRGS